MRSRLAALCLACFPLLALADSVHTLEVINDTRTPINSFSIAPAGSEHWAEVSFKTPTQGFLFDYGLAVTLEFHDDDGCLRDLRTLFSNGRRIYARHFDVCKLHSYRPGVSFHNGLPGSRILP